MATLLIANAMKNGIPPMSRVFFLPILSARKPAAKGPMAAARGRKDPTQPSCALVSGYLRGFSVGFLSFGISGDVQPIVVPLMKAAMFPVIKN